LTFVGNKEMTEMNEMTVWTQYKQL